MKYIVDSSILIDHLRKGPAWKIFLTNLTKNDQLYLPTIVIYELFSGKSSRDANISSKILRTIRPFHQVELSDSIARKAGEIFRDMTTSMEAPDYIIAASTLEIGGTLLTLNQKHFQKVPGLQIYDF